MSSTGDSNSQEKFDGADANRTPIETANVFSRIFLLWMNPLLKKGSSTSIEMHDVFSLPSILQTEKIFTDGKHSWYDHVNDCKKHGKEPSIMTILWRLYGDGIIRAFLFTIPYLVSTVLQPYFIASLIDTVSGNETNFIGIKNGMSVAVLLAGMSLTSITLFNQSAYNLAFVGNQCRSTIITLVFDKSLRISSAAKGMHTTGEILTLISADAERLWNAILVLIWLVIGPILVVIAMGLLFYEVGISTFAGLIIMLLLNTLQGKASTQVGKCRSQFIKYTDERVKVTNEVLQGIRIIKMYNWEDAMAKRIADIRNKEIEYIRYFLLYKSSNTVLQFIGPVLVTFALFVCYYLSGGILTVSMVYRTTALLNIIRMPMWLTPQAWANCSEAMVSMRRVTKFLLLEEISQITANCDDKDNAVVMTDATFYWNSKHATKPKDANDTILKEDKGTDEVNMPVLSNVTINIKKGSLTAVVGKVGSGKSSLISAMLGQLHISEGTQYLNGKVALVPQEHWIQNQSVFENILFDVKASACHVPLHLRPIDIQLYRNVIDVSQLTPDLMSLTNADYVMIGERGVNLSGGQKSRVSICRALYQLREGCDVYIFDDSLSAVDMHVSKTVFNKAIKDLLQNVTRIVVLSSNYHLLSQFDQIIIVDNGKIVSTGTFDEIAALHPEYLNYGNNSDGSNTAVKEDATDTHNEVPINTFSDSYDSIVKKRCTDGSASLMTVEEKESGSVKLSTYVNYFSAAADSSYSYGTMKCLGMLLLFFASQLIRLVFDVWIGLWPAYAKQSDEVASDGHTSFSILQGYSNTFFLQGYIVLAIVTVILVIARSYYFTTVCIASSRNLHNKLLKCVLAAPINTYFDVTPIGRIMNRFSKDLDCMDTLLPDFFLQCLQNIFQILAAIISCIASTPYFIIILVPIAIMFYSVQSYFRCSAREMKRLDGISRSPVYTLFTEVLNGLVTIRSYKKETEFVQSFFNIFDTQNANFFYFYLLMRWLAIRLDIVANVLISVIAILSVYLSSTGTAVDPNLLGLALVNTIQLSSLLQWTVRITIDTENNMTATERLMRFLQIEPEEGLNTHTSGTTKIRNRSSSNDSSNHDNEKIVPDSTQWPHTGEIVIDNLQMHYRPELDLVLKGVNVKIEGGNKYGIVGRTGSGKSSLTLSLLRMVEADGLSCITIDGVNIKHLPLHVIRSRLTIVPQDSLLFSGTLRCNLDPLCLYTDDELWVTLERIHMKEDVLLKFPQKLDHLISEKGENISVGQRNMISIGRALLRKSKIIIMDEATASIDNATDALIQKTIRQEFKDCTVLTIAHRLETVADYDFILFLDNGKIVESGKPWDLLCQTDGYFKALVDSLGVDSSQRLRDIAQAASKTMF